MEITVPKGKNIIVGSVYRPPNYNVAVQKEVDRPTRLLQFVAFVHSPFFFSVSRTFCSFTLG